MLILSFSDSNKSLFRQTYITPSNLTLFNNKFEVNNLHKLTKQWTTQTFLGFCLSQRCMFLQIAQRFVRGGPFLPDHPHSDTWIYHKKVFKRRKKRKESYMKILVGRYNTPAFSKLKIIILHDREHLLDSSKAYFQALTTSPSVIIG